MVSYHGHFANALGRLESRTPSTDGSAPPAAPSPRKFPWAYLILRAWHVAPERCPGCQQVMRRTKTIVERAELLRLLRHLGLGRCPPRPPPAPIPEAPPVTYGAVGRPARPLPLPPSRTGAAGDDISQIPPGWEEWTD
jgi:hypothetical protein